MLVYIWVVSNELELHFRLSVIKISSIRALFLTLFVLKPQMFYKKLLC